MTHSPAVVEEGAEFVLEEDFMVAACALVVVTTAVPFAPEASTAVAAIARPEEFGLHIQ